MSFLYVGGHLPFCLGRVPYFRTNSSALEPYGEGTIYPLSLEPDVFAACFWRVKAWKFSGTLSFFTEVGGTTYEGETTFEKTFYRTPTEDVLICAANTVPNSPFTTETEDDIVFSGTATTDGDTESVDVTLRVKMAVRTSTLSTFRQVALDTDTGLLKCYFAALLIATVPGLTVGFAQTEEYVGDTYQGDLVLSLPGGQSQEITLSMFGANTTLSDIAIVPAEYYDWGGIYEPQTGDQV